MSKTSSPARLHVKQWMGAVLAISILLGQAIPAHSASQNKKERVARDFLPPVASINPKLTQKVETGTDNDLEPVALAAVHAPVLHASPKVEKLDTNLSATFKTEQLESLLEIQKKVDEADLEYLWQATVEKNPVIRFSLEKLATPPDLQPSHSSQFMRKTLSTLISGAALGTTMLPGASAYQNMGSMAVGNAMQNLVNGRTRVNPNGLTPTEQIQMAGLIDELKLRLIHSYQDYKNTLQNLAQSHQVTVRNNSAYSKALTSKNDLAIMAAGTAYYQALLNETTLRQKAKLSRLSLERLAGPEAVKHLELAVHVPENVSTASASPIIKEPTEELVGPLPIETISPTTTAKKPEFIGPELPPAKIRSLSKAGKKTKPASNNEIPQPMEIGPKLKESSQIKPVTFPEAVSSSNSNSPENPI